MATDLRFVSWSVHVNFIAPIQLRPQCGRNSIGISIAFLFR